MIYIYLVQRYIVFVDIQGEFKKMRWLSFYTFKIWVEDRFKLKIVKSWMFNDQHKNAKIGTYLR